jgi:aryl-alcohol dehydrogenase-like predicted oxidoreductase
MELRRLGNSDLHITPVGFGAWAIGGSEFSLMPNEIAEIERAAR